MPISGVHSVNVLGVRIDDVTYDEALALLRRALAERTPTVVTTPNPEIVMLARQDPDFLDVLNRCHLNIPDGIGLLLAARLAGDCLRQHVQGTDLVLRLAAAITSASVGTSPAISPPTAAGAIGRRWFLLGGHGDVAARAGAALAAQFPGLIVAGAAPGSPAPEDDVGVRSLIRAAGEVDVVLVAYGAPKQERWLDRNLAELGIPIGIGVGGVFNYLSGDAPRASAWVRRLHFEWLHRLLTQPWRWRRQLALPQFAALSLMQSLPARLSRRSPHARRS
jgi:N-acetylglucosaminyldiphosphoundecaprenol N-acetyl-beta-D-mannosaminyltransferase